MAENEYLDTYKYQRWRAVVQAIIEGQSVDGIRELVEDCLFKTLRQMHKELPFEALIGAMGNPDELMKLCQGVQGGNDVKPYLIQAAFEKADRTDQLEAFIDSSLGHCLHDLPFVVLQKDETQNITDIRATLTEVHGLMDDEVRRVAQKMAENPGRVPSRRRSPNSKGEAEDRTSVMLGQSILK